MSFYESLVNSVEETIIAVNLKNRIDFMNRAGEELFGIHSESIRGKKLSVFFRNDATITPLVKKAIREMRPISSDNATLKIKENARFDFTVSPLIEKDNAEGAVILLRQRHYLLDTIDDQFDTVMYLLSSVAHEIKNPLTGIRGGAQLMKKKVHKNESKYLDIIIKETQRLDNVVKSYLFVGRKPVFNMINIHEVIEETLNVLDPELQLCKIALKRSYDPSLPQVRGDEGKLLQVFMNIVKNAMEAMPKGGTLEIKTKPAFEYMVEKKQRVKRRFAVISFKDTGTGIAEGDVEKIFMPFFSRKKKGSGLGLAISKKIIRDHKGLIKIRSIRKKGLSIGVYLPFAEQSGKRLQ
ncbi:PAS domain S-box protein [bacterium]|nr:MAG: PAS domain S-box protein [bacterium]